MSTPRISPSYDIARTNGIERGIAKIWEQIVLHDPSRIKDKLLAERIEEDLALLEYLKSSQKKTAMYKFVTINPPKPADDLEERETVFHLQQFMDKINERPWLDNLEWVYEFHSKDTGKYTHPHVHMIFRSAKPKAHIIREFDKTRKACLLGGSPQSIDVQYRQEKDLEKTRRYLLKFDRYAEKYPGEQVKRKLYGLQRIYPPEKEDDDSDNSDDEKDILQDEEVIEEYQQSFEDDEELNSVEKDEE